MKIVKPEIEVVAFDTLEVGDLCYPTVNPDGHLYMVIKTVDSGGRLVNVLALDDNIYDYFYAAYPVKLVHGTLTLETGV